MVVRNESDWFCGQTRTDIGGLSGYRRRAEVQCFVLITLIEDFRILCCKQANHDTDSRWSLPDIQLTQKIWKFGSCRKHITTTCVGKVTVHSHAGAYL